METLITISCWQNKHVGHRCAAGRGISVPRFYLFDAQKVAFCYLTKKNAPRADEMVYAFVLLNGKRSAETVVLIRGVQLKGEIRRLSGEKVDLARMGVYTVAFRLPECCRPRCKTGPDGNTSPTTRWALQKMIWLRGSGTEQA